METSDTKPQPQVCIIKVVFPSDSDELAMSVKKKIAAATADMDGVQINFNLIAGQAPMPGR